MERNLAVLIDFENIATGCEKEGLGRMDLRVVMRRLKDKGRILVGRAYADWGRWSRFKMDLVHEGITMVELTNHGMQSKNRADIALAVDAMELAYTRDYLDTFVVLSGDSDFTPLVMRLKELNKRVIGCGTRGSTSRLIAEVCDEFIFYESIRQETRPAAPVEEQSERFTLDEGLELLLETLVNHQRDEPRPVHTSVLKASMKRKDPTFDEMDLGMRTFTRFVEAAQKRKMVRLIPDERAGGYLVDMPGSEPEAAEDEPQSEEVRRLVEVLAKDGIEIGSVAERRFVIEALVAVSKERAQRNRKNVLEYVLSDTLRRTRQQKADISQRTVKGVVNALLKASLLAHPDGGPTRSMTALIMPPASADALLHALNEYALGVLESRGEIPADEPFAELFGSGPAAGEGRSGDGLGRLLHAAAHDDALPPAAETVAEPIPAEIVPPAERAAPAEGDEAAADGDAPKKRARRGGRRGRKTNGEAAAETSTGAPTGADP